MLRLDNVELLKYNKHVDGFQKCHGHQIVANITTNLDEPCKTPTTAVTHAAYMGTHI